MLLHLSGVPHLHVNRPLSWFRVNETPLKLRTNQVFYRLKIRPVPCELA